MSNLDEYVEGRGELSFSIERIEELLDILENLEKQTQ